MDEALDLVRGSVSRLGIVRWSLAAVVVTVIGGVLLTAAFQARSAPRHTVGGIALIDGKPLGRVTLVFHSQDQLAEPFSQSVFTAEDGSFRNDPTVGIPAGNYSVVIHGGPSAPRTPKRKTAGVPQSYRDPTTTPLRVEIAGDTTGLQLMVRWK